jgi:hypothetical protein
LRLGTDWVRCSIHGLGWGDVFFERNAARVGAETERQITVRQRQNFAVNPKPDFFPT